MKKLISITAIFAMMLSVTVTAQVLPQRMTGFSDFKLYLDPGHSGTSNRGYGEYSESEKNLDVAFYIKEFLMLLTDMPAENFMFSRTTHTQAEIAFSTKADQAYAFGADMYFSPHSDASGSPAAESTLMLYGGRRLAVGAAPVEKLPEGGKRLGDFLIADMTSAMRMIRSTNPPSVTQVATRGNVNDLNFFASGTGIRGPWLAVHSQTNNRTASILTEAGFHTNPTQNMQFTNREHRRMQGYTNAQSIIRWWTERQTGTAIEPPQLGIVTGFVFDDETARFVNGATITVTEGAFVQTYVTDTWESLQAFLATLITVGPAGQTRPPFWFNPATFGTGFYWLEGFTPGATVNVRVEAPGFETVETTVTIPLTAGAVTNDGLGVADIPMLNIMPPVIEDVAVALDHTEGVIINRPLTLRFSRGMVRTTVEQAISIVPAATGLTTRASMPISFSWMDDFTLNINISNLEFETDYILIIDGSVARNSHTNQYFDGTGEGIEGVDFVWYFTTQETAPPAVVSFDPQGEQEMFIRPIVRLEFDRPLNPASIGANQLTVRDENGNLITGTQEHREINGRSVMHFFFDADLTAGEFYTVTLEAGVTDMTGRPKEEDFVFNFLVRARPVTANVMLEQFGNIPLSGTGDWRAPGLAGQTQGEVAAGTYLISDANVLPGTGTRSLRVNYQWASAAPAVVRELRLNNWTLTNSVRLQRQNTNYIQYYLFGDGSRTRFSVVLREVTGPNAATGNFLSHAVFEMDWIGWRRITWDLSNYVINNPYLGGTDPVPYDRNVVIQGLRVLGATAEHVTTDPGAFWVSQIQAVQMDRLDEFTVTFNSTGGSAVNPVTVLWGERLTPPADPTRDGGYVFAGWYTEAGLVNAWDFENDKTRVFGNITLYARWEIAHRVTFSVIGVNGTLTAATADGTAINTNDYVPVGTDIHFTATPDAGFRVREWTVNGDIVVPTAVITTRTVGETLILTVESIKDVTVEFESDGTTGLCNIAFANLQIHPNPFVSEVTITGAQNSVLEIVNVLGTVVHTQPIHNSTETIQLEQLSSGIYFFRLSRDGQSRTLQVVKR